MRQIGAQAANHHRLFLLSALALAVLGGLVLAIHIPVGRLLDWQSEARRPDMVQAHGQVQLLGFVGLFVMGMSLRLMPRFAGTHLQFENLVGAAWALTFGAVALRAFVMLWLPEGPQGVMMIATQYALLLGAGCYALLVFGTLLIDTRPMEGTGWLFCCGATFFVIQAAFGAFVAVREASDPTRVMSYLPDMALLYLQLGGFLMPFVAGVATRAIPTMLGLPRPEAGAKRLAVALSLSTLLVAAPLAWLEYGSYSDAAARLSDAGLALLGCTLVSVALLTGNFWPAANRTRAVVQPHMRIVRMALYWLAFSGVYAVYLGMRGVIDGGVPSFEHLDAFRHALALGAITSLIVGMALMIVPEFAVERQTAHAQGRDATLILVLLFAASVLRVAPGLASLPLQGDARNLMLAVAGVLVEGVLLFLAYRFVRILLRLRRSELPIMPRQA